MSSASDGLSQLTCDMRTLHQSLSEQSHWWIQVWCFTHVCIIHAATIRWWHGLVINMLWMINLVAPHARLGCYLDGLSAGSEVSCYVTNHQSRLSLHPSGIGKLSTGLPGLRWATLTCVGWLWHGIPCGRWHSVALRWVSYEELYTPFLIGFLHNGWNKCRCGLSLSEWSWGQYNS